MKWLESLDFSGNQLSGEIPPSISLLTMLSPLNPSDNNLTGGGTHTSKDPEQGNMGGSAPLDKVTFYGVVMLGFAIGFWGAIGILIFKKSWRAAYFAFTEEIANKIYGTEYIYNYFCRDILAKHEDAIDWKLLELRNKAGDLAVISWQKATGYGLARFLEIFQYASSHSLSLQPNDPVHANKQHRSDSGRESGPGAGIDHQAKPLISSAMSFGDDGEAPVVGPNVSQNSSPGQSKAREVNITLQDKVPFSENGKLKGSPATREDGKTGMFQAAMNRMRRRKSSHCGR
ncbi:hypothetical protein CDL15_Pgr019634 [Punica granatum]|uniref:Uncharacterized protein n=1 Tax=Punica granatum TaxID=22663 RepID=A0A218X5Z3_PUNGR|nr:hypothetical protein CDL15_Pgr019634 [Punica granatum]